MRIYNQPRDFVVDQEIILKSRQRSIGQFHLRADTLLRRFRRDAGQLIAGAQRSRFRQQRLQFHLMANSSSGDKTSRFRA